MKQRDERGMTTSEYAAGTVGTMCMGLVLCQFGVDGYFLSLLQGVYDQIQELFAGLSGSGWQWPWVA